MSEESAESPPWSRLRWSVSVLLILLLHLGGLFALSDWGEVPAPRLDKRFAVRLLTGKGAAERLLETYSLNDPTLLATVGQGGFSGPAWMNISPPPFKLPEWSDRERWLTQDVSLLGADFRSFVRTNLGATLSIAKRTPVPPIYLSHPIAAAEVRSRLFVAGGLAKRPLLAQPQLASQPSTELLHPTEVEVLVNDKGFVFSPRLKPAVEIRSVAQQAAQRAADRDALRVIPQLQFAPLERLPGKEVFPFTKGYLIFQWATIPPPSTNPLAKP